MMRNALESGTPRNPSETNGKWVQEDYRTGRKGKRKGGGEQGKGRDGKWEGEECGKG